MARPSINEIRNLGDFATLYQWNFSFINLPKAISVVGTSDDFNKRCVTSDLPKKNIQSIEVSVRGHKVKQPGIGGYDNTIPITFVETTDMMIHDLIGAWHEATWETGTGIQAPKSEVECSIRLELLDRQDNPTWEYILHGCYLETYEAGGQLGDSTSDVMKPSLTLSYDYFEENKL